MSPERIIFQITLFFDRENNFSFNCKCAVLDFALFYITVTIFHNLLLSKCSNSSRKDTCSNQLINFEISANVCELFSINWLLRKWFSITWLKFYKFLKKIITCDVDVLWLCIGKNLEEERCRQNWIVEEENDSGFVRIFFLESNDGGERQGSGQGYQEPEEEEEALEQIKIVKWMFYYNN